MVLAFALIVLHQLFGAMLETVAHVYRGLGRTDIESTLSLLHRGAVLLAALTALAVQPTLLVLAVALATPSFVALLISSVIAPRVAGKGPSFALTRREFTRHIAPLGLGVLLSALYFRIDVYFLERLHGIEVVGAYNAAFRIVEALRVFPAAALAVAYPMLCAATTLSPLRRASLALTAPAVIVGGIVYLAAVPLLELIYGSAFTSAAPALQALCWSVPFFFLNYGLTYQLIAWERQQAYLAVAGTALVVNLVFDSLLIPTGQMVGAAYATLATEVVVSVGCVVALRAR
jgi:O-antigen/teichoic acid export membrane protein